MTILVSIYNIIWRESMLGHLCGNIICSEKQSFANFVEQIMPADKYQSIFPNQLQVIVFFKFYSRYDCAMCMEESFLKTHFDRKNYVNLV